MKYLKAFSDMETWYFEIDEEGTAYRQLIINEDSSYVASNRKHERAHFCLTDQVVDDKDPYYKRIPKNEFENVWSNNLQVYNHEWSCIKNTLQIGTEVEGYIECFFPQGVIVNLNTYNAVGVVNYDECRKKTPAEWLYPRHVVKAIVFDYDEINQWVVLDKPTIFENQYLE